MSRFVPPNLGDNTVRAPNGIPAADLPHVVIAAGDDPEPDPTRMGYLGRVIRVVYEGVEQVATVTSHTYPHDYVGLWLPDRQELVWARITRKASDG